MSLTEDEIDAILREKTRAAAHRRYMLNRERYKRRATIRYVLQREEILEKMRQRYANDPAFRERESQRHRQRNRVRNA